MKIADLSGYLIYPNTQDDNLTSHVTGTDHTGSQVEVDVVTERGLTVYLNKQEIVTLMTLGDHPEYLALGFLLNQNMLRPDDVVTGVDYCKIWQHLHHPYIFKDLVSRTIFTQG